MLHASGATEAARGAAGFAAGGAAAGVGPVVVRWRWPCGDSFRLQLFHGAWTESEIPGRNLRKGKEILVKEVARAFWDGCVHHQPKNYFSRINFRSSIVKM